MKLSGSTPSASHSDASRERLRKLVKAVAGIGLGIVLLGMVMLSYWDTVGRRAPTSPNPATGQIHAVEVKDVVRIRYVDAEHARGAEVGGYILISGIAIVVAAGVFYGWLFRRWPFQ